MKNKFKRFKRKIIKRYLKSKRNSQKAQLQFKTSINKFKMKKPLKGVGSKRSKDKTSKTNFTIKAQT
jgi:hypothetical protein